MQEDFYWEQCVVMTRKSSILLPMLDLFILKVFEAGLITHWQDEVGTEFLSNLLKCQFIQYVIT